MAIYRRRKHRKCLNCGAKLDEVYNYCPLCGQENTDKNVNFKTLVGDFFNNYLSLDGRFGHSIHPFLFKPGLLTTQFIIGKRVSFIHPIRLYLLLSLFYFFVLSIAGSDSDDGSNNGQPDKEVKEITPFFKVTEGRDSTQTQPLDSTGQYLITDINGLDSLITTQTDSEPDSSDGFWILTGENWEIFKRLKDDKDLTDQQILDSLDTEEMSFAEKILAKQLVRVNRSDSETLGNYIYKNLPIMMFFMLPIFALILKLLYIRRSRLYIHHLVHALHLHSFAYLIYGFVLIPMIIVNNGNIEGVLAFVAFLLVTFYVYKSFRRVYEQGWFKTFLKLILIGPMYGLAMLIALALEVAISVLIY